MSASFLIGLQKCKRETICDLFPKMVFHFSLPSWKTKSQIENLLVVKYFVWAAGFWYKFYAESKNENNLLLTGPNRAWYLRVWCQLWEVQVWFLKPLFSQNLQIFPSFSSSSFLQRIHKYIYIYRFHPSLFKSYKQFLRYSYLLPLDPLDHNSKWGCRGCTHTGFSHHT